MSSSYHALFVGRETTHLLKHSGSSQDKHSPAQKCHNHTRAAYLRSVILLVRYRIDC